MQSPNNFWELRKHARPVHVGTLCGTLSVCTGLRNAKKQYSGQCTRAAASLSMAGLTRALGTGRVARAATSCACGRPRRRARANSCELSRVRLRGRRRRPQACSVLQCCILAIVPQSTTLLQWNQSCVIYGCVVAQGLCSFRVEWVCE